MIRPEHAELVEDPGAGVLRGTVDNVVYFGTDTHYHLHLEDGTPFMVRLQNRRDTGAVFEQGADAGITVKDNAVQVLLD